MEKNVNDISHNTVPNISIIVPIYNAEEFLRNCINSILMQSYKNFELILIDDGSTDSSGIICDELASTDERIVVYHKENGGVSSARNLGIELAQAEYFCFIDADDCVENNYLSVLMQENGDFENLEIENNLSKNQLPEAPYDLVISGIKLSQKNGVIDCQFPSIKKCSPQDVKGYSEQNYFVYLIASVFGKRYKKSLTCSTKFDTSVRLGEDMLFNLSYFKNCKTICILPFAPYLYFVGNQNSATKRVNEGDFHSIIKVYLQGKAFFYGEEQISLSLDCNGTHFNAYNVSKPLLEHLDKTPYDFFDKHLCTTVITLIHLLLYSQKKLSKKTVNATIKGWLSHPLMKRVLKGEYNNLSKSTRTAQTLCRKGKIKTLKFLFNIKKLLRR